VPPISTIPAVRRTLFAERIEITGSPAEIQAAAKRGLGAQEHAHDKALVEAGKLVFGGPYADPLEGSLYILRAASLDEARVLSATRPLVRDGLARAVVTEWKILYEAPL
jgi:uncharacterized protein YciI